VLFTLEGRGAATIKSRPVLAFFLPVKASQKERPQKRFIHLKINMSNLVIFIEIPATLL
jgi:hypothetical protein